MRKMGKRKRLAIYMCLAFFSSIILIIWGALREVIGEYGDFVANTLALISLILASVSVLLLLIELESSGRIQEAEFILHLNQAFVENADYAKVYTELENSKIENRKPNLSRSEVSNYLTFFESMYILLKQRTIDIRNLDDLFSYRFFLAVHDKAVQEIKLVESSYNFRNIYCMEKLWMQYREENELPVYQKENCLQAVFVNAGKEKVYWELLRNLEGKKNDETKIR